jgi:AcrR family transcriptional regulator
MTATLPLRERKKLLTRQALARAAIRLFHEQGYEATTVEQIAAAADCSHMTFFRYFGTKEDVVFYGVAERLTALRAALDRPRDGRSPTGAFVRQAIVRASAELIEVEQATIDLWLTEPALRRRFLEFCCQFEEVIAAFYAKERGVEPDRDLYSQTMAGALIGAFQAALRVHHAEGGGFAGLVDDAIRLVQDGPTRSRATKSPSPRGPGSDKGQ